MADAVHHYDGYVAQPTGDGIFALFGAPVAHEDHPQRALFAALRMQAEVRRYAEKLRAEKGVNLQVRVGVNVGEVVVREIRTGEKHADYTPIGHSTGVAARLEALAAPGSIVISESVRKLVEGYFALKPLGPARIKGVSEPLEIYEVTGVGPLRTRLQRAAARGYTKFVGRDREMEVLRRAAEQAQAGHGQIVAAMAEAGVGKSRLFYEFKVKNQSDWMVLEAVSVSHGKATAYLPLIELLHDYFGIDPDDEPRRRREKVAGKVAMLDRSLEETLLLLFALLGIIDGLDPFASMDEGIRRRRTQDAVKRILLRESLNQPLMLIFEDLHLIDDATQGFLNLLAEGLGNAPVLLLVNYRPEYTHQWGSKTYYNQLRLDPLGQESAGEMLTARIGDSPDLGPLKRLVLERTEGNPLFIEELVEALFDEGVLVRNGAVKVTRPLSQLKIPPTVQGILAARIDRLAPEAKELLQTLAVIGSEFPLALVLQIVHLPDDRLDRLFDVLQAGEFIYEQPAMGGVEYFFKHALTHDEAYNSLLTERRKLLHERTGQAIEGLYQARLEDHYADLAYHYRSSDNAAKAIEYLRLAGQQAVGRGAYAQALANVVPAIGMIGRLPAGEKRLRAELGVRLMEGSAASASYGISSTERLRAFERVCELSEQLRDDSALLIGLVNVGLVHGGLGEARHTIEIARRCLELAERNVNNEVPIAVHYLLAATAHMSGDLPRASSLYRDLMQRLVSARQGIAAEFTPSNQWVIAPASLATTRLALGWPDEALKLVDETLRRARELKHPFSLAWAMWMAARLSCQRREPGAALELANTTVALSEEHGFPTYIALGRQLRGWAMIELGQVDRGLGDFDATARFMIRRNMPLLVRGYIRAGQTGRALDLLAEGLVTVERSGLHEIEAELFMLKGEAILVHEPSASDEAETHFRKAIKVAKGQSAKWWELRATVSLARLLRDTNRSDEARTMLAEIYNWFTEGFDTADLKDAKALLDELSSTPQ
jgi:tetratricopeptide (TPR) repeat protein